MFIEKEWECVLFTFEAEQNALAVETQRLYEEPAQFADRAII